MVLDQQEQSEKLIEEFGRQILVPGINEEGQLNISKKKICIIGLGALGTVASQYLVRAGVGEIHLIDYDIIEKSNFCLLYTSPSPRDQRGSGMPSCA